jgi:hypothetical protein
MAPRAGGCLFFFLGRRGLGCGTLFERVGIDRCAVLVEVGQRFERVFIGAVNGLGRGQILASRLALCFVGRTGDIERDPGFDFGVQDNVDLMHADRLDRLFQIDLVTADAEAFGGQEVGNVAGRDRSVKLTGFAGRTDDDEILAVKAFGHFRRGGLALGIARFDVLALGLEPGPVGIVGPECAAGRQQIVAGEPVLDGDFVADGAELGDAFQQNDFHDLISFVQCCCQVEAGGVPDGGLGPPPGETGMGRAVAKRPAKKKGSAAMSVMATAP